jgi:hypothetical protein
MPTEEPTYCPTNSQDESITSNTAPVQSVRFTLPKDAREIIVAAALALSLMVNVWCGWIIRDVGTAKWLHDWDLNQFQNGPYVETKIKVGELDARIRAVETSQACKR